MTNTVASGVNNPPFHLNGICRNAVEACRRFLDLFVSIVCIAVCSLAWPIAFIAVGLWPTKVANQSQRDDRLVDYWWSCFGAWASASVAAACQLWLSGLGGVTLYFAVAVLLAPYILGVVIVAIMLVVMFYLVQ